MMARERTIPHYLRASTGSCHDLCKYGGSKTNESEEMTTTLPRRSINGPPSEQKSTQLVPSKPRLSNSQKKRTPNELLSEKRLKNPGQNIKAIYSPPEIGKSHSRTIIRSRVPQPSTETKPWAKSKVVKSKISVEISTAMRKSGRQSNSETARLKTSTEKPTTKLGSQIRQKSTRSPITKEALSKSIALDKSTVGSRLKAASVQKPTTEDKGRIKRRLITPRLRVDHVSRKVGVTRSTFLDSHPEAAEPSDLGESRLSKSDGQSSLSSPRCSSLSDNEGECRDSNSESAVSEEGEEVHASTRGGGRIRSSQARKGMVNVQETVVLRHQDVQDRKESMGLFNDVIEERASKLSELRKSKVMALVGAFETVISLQEGKPIDYLVKVHTPLSVPLSSPPQPVESSN
ncbi:uncharacterized protein LOC144702196 [Wolffia australiana]